MKFGISLPKRFLPGFLRSDLKAINQFRQELDAMKASAETAMQKTKKTKRVASNLTLRRKYVATMQQDELKIAVQFAQNPDRPRRDLLYPMYDEVWNNDGHTIGETRKAILKAVGAPFGVFAKGSNEVDEEATRLLQRKWFEDYRTYFHEATFWGHSLVQFIEVGPSQEKGIKMEFKKVELIPRDHVHPEEGYIVMDISDEVGIPFRDDQWRIPLMLMEMGSPTSLGLLRVATKEFIWKNYSRSDWSKHSEKFGMPIVAIKTDLGNTQEVDKLEKTASNFGEDLYLITDMDDEIQLVTQQNQNTHTIYKDKAEFCNMEISKAISGATGTSDEKSFVGGAEVHERILNEFVEASKRAETYHNNEELFPFLIEHGYPLQGKEFRYLNYQENDPQGQEAGDKSGKSGKPGKGAGGADPQKKRIASRASGQSLFR